MKRVISYGIFDLLHYGHINLLKRAKALGDYLVVFVSTDKFNWNKKQKECYFSYEKSVSGSYSVCEFSHSGNLLGTEKNGYPRIPY